MRTGAPLLDLRISKKAGWIALKFVVWLLVRDPSARCVTEVNGEAHVHVRTPFPYPGNSWTDCAEICWLAGGPLAMRFKQHEGLDLLKITDF